MHLTRVVEADCVVDVFTTAIIKHTLLVHDSTKSISVWLTRSPVPVRAFLCISVEVLVFQGPSPIGEIVVEAYPVVLHKMSSTHRYGGMTINTV